ncbi:N-acetylmuramoyl-L-alanine amidase [Fibrella forsythiae]|uniref:N-acetylmuramoyl-L-alanine amidase n=1 Tax=Fibrella forsythiae TaxID=2817061 RepID=A0ABS3JKD2_9BACT|nr:peptidoglycan recognition family protein [Fibrella forsythiae]MBO0950457.1 N-acetylmuramoyl-L-alanine amidase [Fibrella forsythiae]
MSRRARRRPTFDETVMASGTAPIATGFPDTRRFIQAEFFDRQTGRTINRVVIHITSGNQFSSTFYWFRSPRRPIRRISQNGAVIGKIFAPHWLRRANSLEAGHEAGIVIRFAPKGSRLHNAIFDPAIHTLGAEEREQVPVSAHYVVDRDGMVYQFVEENNVAYHAGLANRDSIGIEHVCSPDDDPTEVQYQASARLVNYLCTKYNIPKERSHIVGHQEADMGTDHNCPGPRWNWPNYMALVNRTAPSFLSESFDNALDGLPAFMRWVPRR